jgi:hypothetical protein
LIIDQKLLARPWLSFILIIDQLRRCGATTGRTTMRGMQTILWFAAALVVMMILVNVLGAFQAGALADTVQAPLQAAGHAIRHQAAPASFGVTARTVAGRFVVQARVMGRDIDLIQLAVAR